MVSRGQLYRTALAILLLGNIYFMVGLDGRVDTLESDISEVSSEQNDIRMMLVGTGGANSSQTGSYSAGPITEVPALAYDHQNGSEVVSWMTLAPVPADGLFLNVADIRYRTNTQSAIQNAFHVVQESPYDPAYSGAVLELKQSHGWEVVEGRSIGLPAALGFAATTPGVELNKTVAYTGILQEDGTIGRVTNIPEKARAARDAGMDVMLVPPYTDVSVSGIRIVEVSSFSEATQWALTDDCAEC